MLALTACERATDAGPPAPAASTASAQAPGARPAADDPYDVAKMDLKSPPARA